MLLASPRGYCAGVERAVDTVERALRLYGRPVFVRKQIVHNSHVVRELEALGAVFVDSVDDVDLLLVIGSSNSSNSKRLVEVARAAGVSSFLIDDANQIEPAWIEGVETVGVTSGASAPEKLVERVCDWFRGRGVTEIEPYRLVEEDVEFRLPVELRRELALAAAQE